jgi:hypothetical protein
VAKVYILGPLGIMRLIIYPALPASEIVIVESVTMFTIEIAHIGDVEFYLG